MIFDAILKLFEKREPIDVVTLSEQLDKNGKLKEVGGASYLTELVNGVPSAAHVVQYAQIVAQKATLRRLIEAASQINAMAYDDEEQLDGLLDKAEKILFDVSQIGRAHV